MRPAVALAGVSEGDVILCQITTKPYGARQLVLIDPQVNPISGLRSLSYARTGKLFTGHDSIIVDQIGGWSKVIIEEIIQSIISILRK